MNERIEQLAKQCVTRKFYVDHASEEFDYKKFAELIVGECIGCCEQVISDPVPKSVDTFEQGGIHCMNEIKQHFADHTTTQLFHSATL